jgi:hypothetical protein
MKKLHILQKLYTFQAYKMFANNIFSIGVHWGGLVVFTSMLNALLNIKQFYQKKFPKKKTKYFGELGWALGTTRT